MNVTTISHFLWAVWRALVACLLSQSLKILSRQITSELRSALSQEHSLGECYIFLAALYLLRSRDSGLRGPVVACIYISRIPDFSLRSALFQRKTLFKKFWSDLSKQPKEFWKKIKRRKIMFLSLTLLKSLDTCYGITAIWMLLQYYIFSLYPLNVYLASLTCSCSTFVRLHVV